MKKKLILITTIFLLKNCLVRGQGTFIYDQYADNPAIPSVYFNIPPDPSGQSFVPTNSLVGFVQLYLGSAFPLSGGTMNLNLWSGSITNGTLLGSTDPLFLPSSFSGITNFVFTSPITVTPGTTYYFQPIIQSGESFQVGVVPGMGIGTYTNGIAYFNGTANPSFDLWFREGVISVPEPSPALLVLLGSGVLLYVRRKK